MSFYMDTYDDEEFCTPEENPEDRINELVEILKQRIFSECNKFPLTPRTDTSFLAKFIRSKKYNTDAAFIAVLKYYENLHSNLRNFEGLKPENYLKAYEMNVVRLLKHRHNGAAIVHGAVNRWDTKVAGLRELESAASFVLEELLQDPGFQVNGVIGIIDVSGLAFCHAKQATYHEIKFAIKVILEMFPIRVAGVHFLNTPMLFWPVYKVVMKLLPKKLQERIHIHDSIESLSKVIPLDILPKSLGGYLPEDESWDDQLVPQIISKNLPYDSYWNGPKTPNRPRRLTRKRSSMKMMST